MPTFRFKVEVNNIPKVLAALPKVKEKTLNEIGDAAVKHTQDRAPVEYGTLRDSYMKEVIANKSVVRVGSPMEYAPYRTCGLAW